MVYAAIEREEGREGRGGGLRRECIWIVRQSSFLACGLRHDPTYYNKFSRIMARGGRERVNVTVNVCPNLVAVDGRGETLGLLHLSTLLSKKYRRD
jgi:hypothetical protein